ncbi:N-formylglutamate deformylase [Glycocaulis sp.]|uniref:N-formylglutamate deformylase n=1 Tax=Glycocaulis sp. TaxID=1969725 RepID=UPI00345C35A5
MNPVRVIKGEGPVIIGVPHAGTWLPDAVKTRLNARGKRLADTDWHVDRLYEGLLPGASMVIANFHRYVIDPNRPPEDESLYPGQNTTGLIPLTDFDGEPIWSDPPGKTEQDKYLEHYHGAYHAALTAEIARAKAAHGVAILYDAHSIRSEIPYLFEGVLPDFNIGTAGGTSCDPRIGAAVAEVCARAGGYSHIVNGRFKGGWTTRHYGRPETGVHAIQMELAQSTHLVSETEPFQYDTAKAGALRSVLSDVLGALETLAPDLR